jgi:hypothetical protein
MRRNLLGAILPAALALAGCAVTPPPDTAFLQGSAFGENTDNDTTALNMAEYAFAGPPRTTGRPVDTARAVAALDYMAGELSTNPRWLMISPIPKSEMLQARVAVRQVLGIPVNAPSQVVVTDLLSAANALVAGDPGAARATLAPPLFPPDILQRLTDLPYIQIANLATTHAADEARTGRSSVGL